MRRSHPRIGPAPTPAWKVAAWILAGANLALLHHHIFAFVGFFIVFPMLWSVHATRLGGIGATVLFGAGIALAFPATSGMEGVSTGLVSTLFSLSMGLRMWQLHEVRAHAVEALAAKEEALAALARAQAELATAERSAGADAERRRWAREVHDTLAQGFVSVITLAQAAAGSQERGDEEDLGRRLSQIETVARDNLAEARALVAGEGPTALQGTDLAQALTRLADAEAAHGGVVPVLSLELPGPLPAIIEITALRTVQEALSNVRRHARADSVRVEARSEDTGGTSELVVTITDNGTGTGGAQEGTGLTGMRSRLEAAGGESDRRPGPCPGRARSHRDRSRSEDAAMSTMSPDPVRLLVVDDHPVVRSGIVGMLDREAGLEVVGQAANGREAVELAAALSPQVVLMDLRMPVMDGVAATEALLAAPQPPHIVVLTTYDTDGDILRAVEAGAIGYLLKDAPREEIVAAIRTAAVGQSTLSPTVTTRLVGAARGRSGGRPAPGAGTGRRAGKSSGAPARLSPREQEVLAAVARGLSNSEIGGALYITEATVKTHLMRIYGKLDVDSRTAAVTAALRHGLLDLEAGSAPTGG